MAKARPPLIQIFGLSLLAGVIISLISMPLGKYTAEIMGKYITISPWQEIAAAAILGIFYFGLIIYLFALLIAGLSGKNILLYLASELRSRELVPLKFKMSKGYWLADAYRDISSLFEGFIQSYMACKLEKDKYSMTINTFLDPNLRKEIEERGIHEIYIGGKKKTATIFFSDLRGFTAMTEYYDPDRVITILNDYLSMATKMIDKHGGRVNKYIGDAVMAVFEEPSKYRTILDYDNAVTASLDIQREFKALMKKWRAEIDPLLNLGLGIGLARGQVVSGNIGSQTRMEHTVIGDTVNFASRLCSKAGDGQVIIPEELHALMTGMLETDALEPVEIKGKTGMYNIYSVINRKMITG
ncbi:MAG: adenylate/guanylate cyclase domain-containing protein [Candidatus Goldiibacteriota bacterium]|jgi:class 3 adenylate cyclase